MSTFIDHLARVLDGFARLTHLADFDWRACS